MPSVDRRVHIIGFAQRTGICQVAAVASAWLVRRGEYDDAARLIENEPRFIAELGGRMPWWAQERHDETVAVLRERMGEEALSRARADGRSLSVDETVALALGEDSRRTEAKE